MAIAEKRVGRGRPKRLTRVQCAEAILSIRGHEPSIDELCTLLGVSKATFYNYIPGHKALVEFSGDVICEAMVLPKAVADLHWSEWCLQFAAIVRQTLLDYPLFIQQMSPRPGQMGLLERAMRCLTDLGLDSSTALYAFSAISSIEISAAQARQTGAMGSSFQDAAPSLNAAIDNAPDTPLLHALLSEGYSFSSASIYEDILMYTLEGIARKRGE